MRLYAIRSGNFWCHKFRPRYRDPKWYDRNQIFTNKFNSARLFRYPGTAQAQLKILKEILCGLDPEMVQSLEVVEFKLEEV